MFDTAAFKFGVVPTLSNSGTVAQMPGVCDAIDRKCQMRLFCIRIDNSQRTCLGVN